MSSHFPAPQQPIGAVTMVPRNNSEPSQRIKYKFILYKLGIPEIVLGSFSIFLCVISLVYASTRPYRYMYGLTYVSSGIWCGIFPILSGSFGVCAKNNPSMCIYVTNMVMSIVSACMMVPLLIISSIAAADTDTGLVAIHSLIALASFAALVSNIVHSAYCCAAICCGRKSPTGFVVYNGTQPAANAQYVQLANGQYMLVQNPTIVGQPYPTVPAMQAPNQPLVAPNQPLVYNQAASSSSQVVPPQAQFIPQPPVNFTKEQEADTSQVNPQGMSSVPPAYSAHSFGDFTQT